MTACPVTAQSQFLSSFTVLVLSFAAQPKPGLDNGCGMPYVVHIALQGGLMNERVLNVRIPAREFELLARYADETRRSKSEIVREFLRSLEQKLERRRLSPERSDGERSAARPMKPKKPPAKPKGSART
jgi:hypothetical protein